MARTVKIENIDIQITNYISGLSNKNKQAVLTVVKTIAEAEQEAEFERKWAESVPLEESRQHTLSTVRKLFNEKVVVKSEALQFLDELVAILIESGYFGFVESSLVYVNRIYDFIQNDLPYVTHYETPEKLKHYGNYYVKLKSNKRTMWYVFFDKYENRYLVGFITNNHTPQSTYLNAL